ncbi:amino acid ABC transporter ATP-binding/permease protein [Actinokineospora sp. UTMC 2448]|uniref:amino acid ABC transporter ATP-binding/permease protein n=1 Tax=Actinokineospora sp. UTMC 2448 TaxID=2268449 RepID=UPI0021FBDB94|nr:ATP-binding cassette domain-containing protein [Actinokineospora sp. UTMC 2448]UVS77104.1 putative ABC transporter ATP-binding protein [Actinokineospora sp. UTMC 2448]
MRIVGAAAASVGAELAGVGLMATAGWLLLRAAERPQLGALAIAIVLVRTLALGRGGLRYGERLAGHRAVLEYVTELRGRIYDAVARRRDALSHGDALSRLVSDVDAVQDAVLRCLLPWITAAVVGLTAAGAAFLVDPRAGAVVLAGLLAVALAGVVRSPDTTGPALRARLAEEADELIGGAPELAVFGATGRFRDRAVATSARIAALDRAAPDGVASAFVAVVGGATALAAGVLTAHRGLPVAAAVVLGLLGVFETAMPAVVAARRWPAARAALARIRDLLAITPDEPAPTGEVRLVRATVAGRVSEVDLEVPAGRKIALVGPSGSGKTTLLRLIEGSVRPTGGAAVAADPDVVRGAFADDHVFTATLRDNVLLGVDAEPDDTVLAPWLSTLPDGWATELSATTLSGGQRARLLLARARTARPDVLLLDEPVEGLDPATADALLADVLTRPGAVVVATHRLGALPHADEILVLDNGRVVQRGNHDVLVEQAGYYRDHWLSERALDEFARPASAGGRRPGP